jgi:hypothetical protein
MCGVVHTLFHLSLLFNFTAWTLCVLMLFKGEKLFVGLEFPTAVIMKSFL